MNTEEKNAELRKQGFKIGKNARIFGSLDPTIKDITIGDYSVIGGETYLIQHCPINGSISLGRKLSDMQIIIGHDVYIGYRCIILPGVSIPSRCIVGAGSVITKKFSDTDSIIAGNPAKIIGKRLPEEVIETRLHIEQEVVVGALKKINIELLTLNKVKEIFDIPSSDNLPSNLLLAYNKCKGI